MGKHNTVRRRGAALALAGAVLVGVGAAYAMSGVGSADTLPVLGSGTTYVLPDLAPFTDTAPNADTRGAGAAEVTDEFGAPDGGHDAALKLSTPTGDDKVQVVHPEGGSPLGKWVGHASYSALQKAADNPVQYPSYQLVIDFNGAADGGYSSLTYEPVYNEIGAVTGTWSSYDVGTTGKLCSTKPIPGIIADNETKCDNGGTHTLAEYVAAAPDATVTALVLNQGSGNPGLISAVDKVETPTTTYDFELKKPDDGGVIPPITIPPVIPGHGHGDGHGHGGGQEHGGGQGHQQGHGGHCGC